MEKRNELSVYFDGPALVKSIERAQSGLEKLSNRVVQRRFVPFTFSRAEGEDANPLQIRGHGSVFNVLSEDLGGFREIIHPGAFDRALGKSDIRCLFNHDANMILGRNTSGTLKVGTDQTGLTYDCDMADVTYARDLKVSIARGDVSQSSFAFSVDWDDETERKWKMERTEEGDWVLHHYEVEELYDVSPVTYPAYKAAGVRSLGLHPALRALDLAKEKFEARQKKEENEEKKADEMQKAEALARSDSDFIKISLSTKEENLNINRSAS